MSDLTPVLQELANRADATGMLTPHEIRRVGERRRKRLVVATATCVALATVAAGLFIRGVTWDAVSIDPVGKPTPTTSSNSDDRVGFIGPPPPGTAPTGPAAGQLVAAAELYNSSTWVYADGRIINVMTNFGDSDQFRGYVVRQLTPSGVQAMRSFLVEGTPGLTRVDDMGGALIVRDGGRLMYARDFNGCRGGAQSGFPCPGFTFPERWLPASAWEDRTFRPFVPHFFQICMSNPPGRLSPAESLPSQAADILLAAPEGPLALTDFCKLVAASAAREVADILDQAGSGYVRHEESAGLTYEVPRSGVVMFEPVLPDGRVACTQCG